MVPLVSLSEDHDALLLNAWQILNYATESI